MHQSFLYPPPPPWGRDTGDIALNCQNLTYDVFLRCRGCAGVLISRLINRPLLKELVWKVLLTAHLNIYLYMPIYSQRDAFWRFLWSIRMFSGRGGSRNYRMGRSKHDKVQVFRRCGIALVCGGPNIYSWKKTYNTCNCPWWVGVWISWPHTSTFLWIHTCNLRESVEYMLPKYTVVRLGLQVDISIGVNIMLCTKFKYNKGQWLLNHAKQLLWYLYTASLLIEIYLPLKFKLIPLIHVVVVLCSGQNLSVENNNGQ